MTLSLRTVLPALALTASLCAQPAPPLTHVAIFKVKPDKITQWVQLTQKVYVPTLDKLLAEGTLLAYGVDTDILHRADEPNASAWFAVPNYAAYQKVEEAVAKAQAANAGYMVGLREMMDDDDHFDLLLRSHFGNRKSPPKGALPYTSISLFKAKPGKSPEVAKVLEQLFKPLFDPLVASGDLFSYSLESETQHSQPGALYLVASMPSLASMDKLDAAFAAILSKGDGGKSFTQAMTELTEVEAHRDYIMRAHSFASR
ncbi:MAG: hypothetical protein JJE04_12725 [Acidobacteriia bacterium]|nr:hypothetical protein [Terriglobia bacterium]